MQQYLALLTPQPIAHIGFVWFCFVLGLCAWELSTACKQLQSLRQSKKKNPSLCIKSIVVEDVVEPVSCLIVQTTVFHLTPFSLFLITEAKFLEVTKTDVLWQARSNAVMH